MSRITETHVAVATVTMITVNVSGETRPVNFCNFYFASGAVAKYCDKYVCVYVCLCLCVCLSISEDIFGTTRAIFT